jgi:transposase
MQALPSQILKRPGWFLCGGQSLIGSVRCGRRTLKSGWWRAGRSGLEGHEGKLWIRIHATAPGVSVAQAAPRRAVDANMLFKWLGVPRCELGAADAADIACFLPVRSGDPPRDHDARPGPAPGMIDTSGGHRLRTGSASDPNTLARPIRLLSV